MVKIGKRVSLTYQQRERITEIAYHQIYFHMRETIPKEKFYIFVEAFCRSFGVDYTSITIANTQFIRKIRPTKKELVIFGIVSGVRLKSLGLDYRTIRKYRQELETQTFEMYPRTINRFLRAEMRRFVKSYLKLLPDEAIYLYEFVQEGGLGEDGDEYEQH